MALKSFLDSINLSLEYQYDHAKKSGKIKDKRLFITISRQTGSGGVTIAQKVADILNNDKHMKWTHPWTAFDKNLVKTVLEEHNLPEKCEKYMPEGKVSPINDILDELFGIHPPAITLVHKTNETILHLAHIGNTVIVGKGGSIVTRTMTGGFHARLVGSLESRLKHVMEFYKLDKEEAEKLLAEEDKGRKKYYKEYFNKDVDDPLLYDLVINTDFISHEKAAEIIAYSALSSVNVT